MNSYQTVNAAYAAAGLSKQSAVNFGRAVEGHPYSVADTLPLFRPRRWLSNIIGDSITRELVQARAEQIDRTVFTGQFDRPARVSAFKSEGWDERIASDKDRRRAGLTTGRDQSEDRPAPKYLVQYHDNGAVPKYPWEVVEAATRRPVARHRFGEEATAHAVWLEANR